jgi:hypothetical protein
VGAASVSSPRPRPTAHTRPAPFLTVENVSHRTYRHWAQALPHAPHLAEDILELHVHHLEPERGDVRRRSHTQRTQPLACLVTQVERRRLAQPVVLFNYVTTTDVA